jgi:hypothetical protein
MKRTNDTIWNRTPDLPSCSLKLTAPPHAPYNIKNVCNNDNFSTSYPFLHTREQYNHGSGVKNYYILDADARTSYSIFRTHRPIFLPLSFITERSVPIFAYRYGASKYYTSFSRVCKTGQNCGQAETE